MKPVLILCRHGNTFAKGEKVVMVGAREDLPLTEQGIEQARAVANALVSSQIVPARIVSGPLQRTRVFAEEVKTITRSEAELEIDPRLTEFDYGAWSGLSNEEIVALSGAEALEAWQERSERPSGVTFSPSIADARADAAALLSEFVDPRGSCIVVTSNGRLREFGHLLAPAANSTSYKVKTGHSCVLVCEGDAWHVVGWDLAPEQLVTLLRGF
jgi:broad specificity phosphatase PhoE